MSKIEIMKETRLETAPIHEISATLDYKLSTSSPASVADYVGLSLQNIDDRLTRIKEAESQLKKLKEALISQAEIIKIGSAQWLEESGIDKLDGMYISSISITKSKPKEDVKIINQESLINQGYFKTSVDTTAVKQAIKDGVEVDGAVIEITHIENKIRVNRKRNVENNK